MSALHDMSIDLADYENKTREAVMAFWGNRELARQKQIETGSVDRGERAGVTSGQNMDGFVALMLDIVRANGLDGATFHQGRSDLTLPGYFRPTKLWDLLVIFRNHLVAAIEFKSHIGPSFGNNFNNRAEEAIGTAHDVWTAYREGAFGKQPPPFIGWMILVEDAEKSRRPVRDATPHFPTFPQFQNASYQERYDILCQRLVQEQLYTSAAVITSPRSAADTGEYRDPSSLTNLKTFVTTFAGRIATAASQG